MEKVKERSEILEQDKWKIEDIFETHEDFLNAIKECRDLLKELKKYEGHIMDSSESLEAFLKLDTEISILVEKLGGYTSNRENTDLINEEYKIDSGLVSDLYNYINENFAFITPEELEAGEAKVMSLLTNDYLKTYTKEFKDLFKRQEHILSKHDEELLAKVNSAFTSNNEVMSIFKDGELRFPKIKDEDGNLVELTLNNYSNFALSKNREVRKNAYLAREEVLSKYKNTFTELLKRELKSNIALAKVHNYKNVLANAMFNDDLDESIYYNLIDTVNANLNVLHDYELMRKKVLKIDDYSNYDMAVSLSEVKDKKYTFTEAKSLVMKALSVLGDNYIKDLEKAFNDRWIDKYSNRNKISGAYATTGIYSIHPYVLLNYQGHLDDVSTLAHELGHAMHTFYAMSNQPYQYADYSIFVAEVASTTNELLLNNYILNTSDDKELKLNILNQMLDLIDGTLFRQTMFAEFEDFLYKTLENEKPFTAEILGNKFYELQKKYNGEYVNTLEIGKNDWSRVDHFYYGYYVYKYATSICASLALTKKILAGDTIARDNYLKFLKLGSSVSPLEALKVAGVDLTEKQVINDAISMFKFYLEQYKKLREIN